MVETSCFLQNSRNVLDGPQYRGENKGTGCSAGFAQPAPANIISRFADMVNRSLRMTRSTTVFRSLSFAFLFYCLVITGFNADGATRRRKKTLSKTATAKKAVIPVSRSQQTRLGTVAGGPWTEPTYADSTNGDNIDGEDLNIRRLAVESLGPYNGSVVVVDPENGRILSMVNQKLALSSGFQPCSTVKVSVALAGLSEKVIQPSNQYHLPGLKMDLTYALAHSNNYYFATLGEK